MQRNRKTIGQTGGRKQTSWAANETDFSDGLCLIFEQKIVLWWRRAIAANRRSLRKTEGLRQEGRWGKEPCGEPGRDVSHPERDMTPCQMNRDIKSWCQETEERDHFWPCVLVCVCMFSSISCSFVCVVRSDSEYVYVHVWRRCLVGVVQACVTEKVKSKKSEFLNIISSWVSRDCFFASVHQGEKITFYCAHMCLCGKVKKMWKEEALPALWFIAPCPSPLLGYGSVLPNLRIFSSLANRDTIFQSIFTNSHGAEGNNIYVTVYLIFIQRSYSHFICKKTVNTWTHF